jgi:hypothetical protein
MIVRLLLRFRFLRLTTMIHVAALAIFAVTHICTPAE